MGACNPLRYPLSLAYQDNLANMNGGDTVITNNRNSITNISSLGIWRGKYFQVFAPIQNENIYTNLWRGPFWGYQRVIETFKLTDKPRRIKPIDVYYHFYSATKRASLAALNKVYRWALSQPVFNIYVSEFFNIAQDFNHITLAQNANQWIIKTNGALRELRIFKTMGYPDLRKK